MVNWNDYDSTYRYYYTVLIEEGMSPDEAEVEAEEYTEQSLRNVVW